MTESGITPTALDQCPSEPGRNCPLCPRLVSFRESIQGQHPGWHNAPVPSFGDRNASLLIVGLAPGLQGANRTGRPFTGDYAGDLLYSTLLNFGFSRGIFAARPDDGLELINCRITNAVRCVPPENKPTPEEIRTCRPFLASVMSEMPNLRAVLALGKIAHDSTVRALAGRIAEYPFLHGGSRTLGAVRLFSSYHCSRYNTNTGVLTQSMFEAVFADIAAFLLQCEQSNG